MELALNNSQIVIDAVNHYHSNPIDFVVEMLGATPEDWQKQAFDYLMEKHFLAIASGSGVGKTCLLAWIVIWFMFTRPHSKVPCTAPSSHQLFDILWSEIFKWIQKNPMLISFFDWTQTKVAVKGSEPNWFAVARTSRVQSGSDVAEGLQGFHDEKNLMFLLDEASGIPDAVYPAVEGALTGDDCYAVLAGNPTRTTGFFYEIFHNRKMGEFYRKMTVSCYDSTRVSQRYIDMMESRYGKDHPIFQIKVLGEFATADESLLIPPDFIERMLNNSKVDCRGFNTEFGVDVGRSKASSILCVRQGYEILKWDERHKKGLVTDTLEIVRWVTDNITEFKPTHVKVDANGIGAGVYDLLKETYGNMIVPVIGAASPGDTVKERYLNLRAQGCWEFRELTPYLYCKKWPDRMITEMGDVRTEPTLNKKIKIESKETMLARSMKSPDYFDAGWMAFLDSDLCSYERIFNYIAPTQVLEVNKHFKRVPIWGMPRNGGTKRKSRWSRMDG